MLWLSMASFQKHVWINHYVNSLNKQFKATKTVLLITYSSDSLINVYSEVIRLINALTCQTGWFLCSCLCSTSWFYLGHRLSQLR